MGKLDLIEKFRNLNLELIEEDDGFYVREMDISSHWSPDFILKSTRVSLLNGESEAESFNGNNHIVPSKMKIFIGCNIKDAEGRYNDMIEVKEILSR